MHINWCWNIASPTFIQTKSRSDDDSAKKNKKLLSNAHYTATVLIFKNNCQKCRVESVSWQKITLTNLNAFSLLFKRIINCFTVSIWWMWVESVNVSAFFRLFAFFHSISFTILHFWSCFIVIIFVAFDRFRLKCPQSVNKKKKTRDMNENQTK